jgi:hypothetical protein
MEIKKNHEFKNYVTNYIKIGRGNCLKRRSRTIAGKPDGNRRVGRPAIRWLDSVVNLKVMGIRNWRLKPRDRNQWRAIFKEARVRH